MFSHAGVCVASLLLLLLLRMLLGMVVVMAPAALCCSIVESGANANCATAEITDTTDLCRRMHV